MAYIMTNVHILNTQLPHSYYFTTHFLVLKFANKGVLKSQCFITKKGLFSAEKLVFCSKIGGHFQTGEQGWVPLFPVREGAGTKHRLIVFHGK